MSAETASAPPGHQAVAPARHPVAASFGFDGITGYISDRRGAGWTWRAIAAESGQPQSWLRRHQLDPDQAGMATVRPPDTVETLRLDH
jgi:hypothetical protein